MTYERSAGAGPANRDVHALDLEVIRRRRGTWKEVYHLHAENEDARAQPATGYSPWLYEDERGSRGEGTIRGRRSDPLS